MPEHRTPKLVLPTKELSEGNVDINMSNIETPVLTKKSIFSNIRIVDKEAFTKDNRGERITIYTFGSSFGVNFDSINKKINEIFNGKNNQQVKKGTTKSVRKVVNVDMKGQAIKILAQMKINKP